jgi:hypothetical protein
VTRAGRERGLRRASAAAAAVAGGGRGGTGGGGAARGGLPRAGAMLLLVGTLGGPIGNVSALGAPVTRRCRGRRSGRGFLREETGDPLLRGFRFLVFHRALYSDHGGGGRRPSLGWCVQKMEKTNLSLGGRFHQNEDCKQNASPVCSLQRSARECGVAPGNRGQRGVVLRGGGARKRGGRRRRQRQRGRRSRWQRAAGGGEAAQAAPFGPKWGGPSAPAPVPAPAVISAASTPRMSIQAEASAAVAAAATRRSSWLCSSQCSPPPRRWYTRRARTSTTSTSTPRCACKACVCLRAAAARTRRRKSWVGG